MSNTLHSTGELNTWLADTIAQAEPARDDRLSWFEFCLVQVDRLFKKYDFHPHSLEQQDEERK